MKEKTVAVSGLATHYLETNSREGIPLIILHGWASSAARWSPILLALEKIGIHAVALNFPGRGKTPAPSAPWNLDTYTNFVLAFAHTLGFEKFHLLGHSFGGRVCIKIAARGDDTGLAKLILVDAAGVTPRDKKRIFVYKLGTKIGDWIFSLPLLRMFRKFARKVVYFFSGAYDFYVLEGAMRETFRKIVSEDLTPLLGDITAQTLILWGEADKMTPLSDARLMKQKIRRSRLVIVPGGSHSLNLDSPQRVADEVVKFLQ